ncbi:hypothetical protein PSECIP111951_00172 [Pseudoalteromonas holothuriae]|uniref:Glutathionylspermidine synthase pre-ATP-grasp-like domain-containing protein n=1 Tax=Pseudoalteromonas holothuriae TaxID=2963714 RepID=A0A9W4QTG1_9GAMM|nr:MULTISPECIES: hypothetical protein [unclassified Pseudoalteromonas]CAH9050339.1 hypothetical protein PSECIP111951_00172 [Pseudoalteromonas sp. CIP111951]CAH9052340.1 hypothetical protein PSECIP111854_00947 [Pseudoalteromonas sp. CIP111854]
MEEINFKKIIEQSYRPLGEASEAFVRYAIENESLHKKQDYRVQSNLPGMIQNYKHAIQSWPLFISSQYMAKIQDAVTVLPQLLTRVPELFFANNSEAVCDYFGVQDRLLVNMLMSHKWRNESVIARGDFINTAQGFMCLEQNVSSNIGGWQLEIITKSYLESDEVKTFLMENNYQAKVVNVVYDWLNHAVTKLKQQTLSQECELNIFVSSTMEYRRDGMKEYFQGLYQRVLMEHGLEGSLILDSFEALTMRERKVWYGDTRVIGILNPLDERVPKELLRAYMSCKVYFIDNLLSFIYGDKRCLALLSTHADNDDLFTERERSIIHAHLPWTREISLKEVEYEGKTWNLYELATELQDQFVLKHAKGMQGRDLFIGCKVSKEEWLSALQQTKSDNAWVIQQYYQSNEYIAQSGDNGIGRFNFIWGTFCFGDKLSRAWIRLMSSDNSSGIINSHKGAEETQVFVVDSVIE